MCLTLTCYLVNSKFYIYLLTSIMFRIACSASVSTYVVSSSIFNAQSLGLQSNTASSCFKYSCGKQSDEMYIDHFFKN